MPNVANMKIKGVTRGRTRPKISNRRAPMDSTLAAAWETVMRRQRRKVLARYAFRTPHAVLEVARQLGEPALNKRQILSRRHDAGIGQQPAGRCDGHREPFRVILDDG